MQQNLAFMAALLTALVKARRNKCTMCLDEENIQLACVLVVPGFQIVPREEQNNNQSHILNL